MLLNALKHADSNLLGLDVSNFVLGIIFVTE